MREVGDQISNSGAIDHNWVIRKRFHLVSDNVQNIGHGLLKIVRKGEREGRSRERERINQTNNQEEGAGKYFPCPNTVEIPWAN